mgnify:CR=1 FL=1
MTGRVEMADGVGGVAGGSSSAQKRGRYAGQIMTFTDEDRHEARMSSLIERAFFSDPPPRPTVRVRIAVVVSADGRYMASANYAADDERNISDVEAWWGDNNIGSTRLVWVEADVPLPRPETVKGEVAE